MSIKAYKITTVSLAIVVVWLAWMYWVLFAKMVNGAFISHQADLLRQSVKDADQEGVIPSNAQANSNRDRVLFALDWYIGYYDHRTNALARSPVYGFIKTEREYVVRDTIAYLRKTGTNDFGDDPYVWLKHEYAH